MEYKASLDGFSKSISIIFIAFSLVVLAGGLSGQMWPVQQGNFVICLVAAFMLLLAFAMYLFSPRAYAIEGKDVVIHRRAGRKRIPAADIIRLRMPDAKELSWPVRTFGNGGLFGYTGRYYTRHIGYMIWYCTRRDRQLVVERNFKLPVILSPDNPGTFLHAYYQS